MSQRASPFPIRIPIGLDVIQGSHERQQGDGPGAFDGLSECALVFGARSGDALGNDLAALSNEIPKRSRILVVDYQFFVSAKSANLSAMIYTLFRCGPGSG